MIGPPAVVGSTPLDDFLDDSGSSTGTGELLQDIGLFGSLGGITLAAGLIAFLALAHRGRRNEVTTLLRLVAIAGGLTFVGASVELIGVATIGELTWMDALTDTTGSAAMMRLLAGLMIVLGLFEQTVPVDAARSDAEETEVLARAADNADAGSDDTDDDADSEDDGDVRWYPGSASAFGVVGAAIGILSFWFDGHTVTRGPRAIHAAVDAVHVAAGSIWFGGVVGLTIVATMRRSTRRSIAPVLVRFSSIATVALILVALAGGLMTLMIIDGLGDLTGTEWGRLLLVKVAAVAVTTAIGGYNHVVVVPALDAADSVDEMERRARATVAAESVVLLFVVALTVLLTSASTN